MSATIAPATSTPASGPSSATPSSTQQQTPDNPTDGGGARSVSAASGSSKVSSNRPSSNVSNGKSPSKPTADVTKRQHSTQEGDHDSGVDENTQGGGGGDSSPTKPAAGGGRVGGRRAPTTPDETGPGARRVGTNARSRPPVGHRPVPRSKSVPKPFTSWTTPPSTSESGKKVPMNKIVVGTTQSPNLKQVKSKIGSLQNASHKPGGGEIRIENRKLDWKKEAKTEARNTAYKPGGGEKKIENRKLDWNTASKIGSLDNAKHKPGGGQVKIINEKRKFEVTSKVGSMDNVKHKPAGGDKKVFNDVDYLKQMSDHHPALFAKQSGHSSHVSSRRESGSQSECTSLSLSSRKSSSISSSGGSSYLSNSRKTSSNSQADSGIGGGGPVLVDIDIGELADFDDESAGRGTPTNLKKVHQHQGSKEQPGKNPIPYQMKRRLSPMSNGF